MTTKKTKVIFRKWADGEIIALFPEICADLSCKNLCGSYMHVGQHGSANYDVVLGITDLAAPEDYAELKQELEQRGYSLAVYKRQSPQMKEKRYSSCDHYWNMHIGE